MARGGKRPGAGRKPGTFNKSKLERMAVVNAFNQRILDQADALFNAQLTLAVGSVMVYRVEESQGSKGQQKREHILVTSREEIREVLDGIESGCGTVGDSYYFVTSVAPDNRALDSLLNRGLGKPVETHIVDQKALAEASAKIVAERLVEQGWKENEAREFVTRSYPEVSSAIN